MDRQRVFLFTPCIAVTLLAHDASGRRGDSVLNSESASAPSQMPAATALPEKRGTSYDELLTAIYTRWCEQDVLAPIERMNPQELLEHPHGGSLVPLAVQKSLPKAGVALVRLGLPCDSKGSDGRTALMYAARNGDLELCRWLKSQGADCQSKDIFGWTSADFAAAWGHFEVEYVLESTAGAGLGSKKRYISLLCRAAVQTDVEIIRFTLREGADVNSMNETGATPLMEGVRGGSPEAISLLLAAGADPDLAGADGTTAREEAREALKSILQMNTLGNWNSVGKRQRNC